MIKDLVIDAMKKTFRPKFLNRIDEIIVFNPTFFARLDSKVNFGFQAENFGMASSASLLAGMKSSDLS